jgi:hypothetical protein
VIQSEKESQNTLRIKFTIVNLIEKNLIPIVSGNHLNSLGQVRNSQILYYLVISVITLSSSF